MSKVDEMMDKLSSLLSEGISLSKLEYLVLAASSTEDQLAYSTNLDSPELSILMYNICNRNEEFRLAVKAVNAQLDKDAERSWNFMTRNKHLT